MSSTATAWAWSQQIESHSAKLVLLCLAESHDACSGRVDCDVPFISRTTGLSQKTVKEALKRLDKLGVAVSTEHSVSPPGFSLPQLGGAA